ncbi:MAG TPA: hypothetical protein VFI47_05630, partial [Acidimicrobiales bacterium]|nr:hypothetical protein [Acidimicrobiales bacterium]
MVASTATDDTGTAPAPTAVAAAPPTVDRPTPAVGDDRRARLLALALALLPFAVSAVALVLAVGGRYVPSSDHAMTEMQIRDVGRHDVLVGLYSRADWNHPGPMIFYLLAPFYWLTGGLAIGMNLGALAINGGSVAGMGLIARRRGGTPLMLLTLLGCTLLLRTLGAEFAHDPWNCFITTLPFGLMIFLAWSMWCGEAWALPVGAVVATFLTQTHIGFVVLALPLLAWGGLGLAVSAWRGGSTAAGGGPAGTHGNGSAAAAGVGHPDGNGDGDPGTAVGTALDTAVGTALDTAVGTALDTAVGTALDTAVGTALDTAVGTALDTAVGTARDTAVGTALDTAVGT